MKKLVLIILLILMTAPCLCQNKKLVFDENTLSVINKKLLEYEKEEPPKSIEEGYCPILVANLLDDAMVYNESTDENDYDTTYHGRFNPGAIRIKTSRPLDIFRIVMAGSTAAYNHILLVNGEKMTFINMKQPYDKIMQELLAYFRKNKDVDDRLLPLYNERIIYWFMRNHRRDELGKWYKWYEQKDSVSREYIKFQYPDSYK